MIPIVPVVRIGCLECGNPSNLLGVYLSLDEAKEAHPDGTLRSTLSDDGDGGWHDSYLIVIFDVAGKTA